jgi:2-polyprenyl-6-methoxyphenol hydroxylase-like FAD-dependent oxidoreductase
MLVERNETTTRHPKMDITNARSMELFRRMGIAEELRAVAVAEDHPFDVSWITSFAGHELHRFRYPSVVEARERIRRNNDGTQPREAPMRVSHTEIEPVLKRAIERMAGVDVRFGVQLVDLAQDGHGVTATLRRKLDDATETVRCAYLVGCDGGSSQVRRCLDIPLSGQSNVMQRFMTHFKSDAREVLQRWGFAWHYQSNHGTLIAQNDRDTWTLHSRFPESASGGEPDPAALVRRFVGVDIEHRILVANPWTPHLVVADRYVKGRVLIAGDAAHQYIPTGGYGMNTGIGDACDVAWKLAAILHGFGGPALIESYEAERRPVGLRNCEMAGRHNQVRVQIGKLYDAPLEAPGAEGASARAYASGQIRTLGNAENESFGIELGYIYADSPLVFPESGASVPAETLTYVPTAMPGARLPSVFLDDGSALYDRLGDWFTLLVLGDDPDAADAFQRAATMRGLPFTLLKLDQPQLLAVYAARLVLVRPDNHVAWRGNRIADDTAAARVLARALGWPAGEGGAAATLPQRDTLLSARS